MWVFLKIVVNLTLNVKIKLCAEVSQVPGGNVLWKTNIQSKNGHECDWAWFWSSLHLFKGPAQSLWKPFPWRNKSAKANGITLLSAQYGRDQTPDHYLFVVFLFAYWEGVGVKGHWLSCKTPFKFSGGLWTLGRIWPIKLPGGWRSIHTPGVHYI